MSWAEEPRRQSLLQHSMTNFDAYTDCTSCSVPGKSSWVQRVPLQPPGVEQVALRLAGAATLPPPHAYVAARATGVTQWLLHVYASQDEQLRPLNDEDFYARWQVSECCGAC